MQRINLDEIQPRFMWLDPASGKKKEAIRSVRARSAIVVVGTDVLNRIYVLDAWADRVGTNEIRKKFVDLCEFWGPQIAAFEDMGQQSLLFDPIMDEAAHRGISIPLAAIKPTNKVDKRFRIRATIQPVYGAGRLIIDESLIELINEITGFPLSPTMDLVDAMASAIALVPPATTEQKTSDDAAELARYLRESGASMDVIEQRMAEIGAYGKGHQPMDTSWTQLRRLWNKEKIN